MFFFILSDLNMFRNPLNEKLCLPPQRFDNGHLLQEQGPAENANSGIQQQEALGVNNCAIGTVIALFQLEHVVTTLSMVCQEGLKL